MRTVRGRRTWAVAAFLFLVALVGIPSWMTYREFQRAKASAALITAIVHHDTPAVLAALDAGADPNARQDEDSPSFARILRDFWNRLRGRNSATGAKATALLLATRPRTGNEPQWKPGGFDVRLIRALLEKGADCNVSDKNGRTPLMFALDVESEEAVPLLLEHGADVNARDSNGVTALMFAAPGNSVKNSTALLEHGADIKIRDKYFGKTALIWASDAGSVENVKILLKHGADVNASDNNGDTALNLAAVKYPPIEELKVLLEHGANVNAKDRYGWTALTRAAASGVDDKVQLLLDHGADIHAKGSRGYTAMDWAKKQRHPMVVALLEKAGAK